MDYMTNAQLMKELSEYAIIRDEFPRHYDRCLQEVERRLSEIPLVVTDSVSVHHDLIEMKMRLKLEKDLRARANNECSYMKKNYEALLSAHNALADDRLRIIEQRDEMKNALEDIRFSCASALPHSS